MMADYEPLDLTAYCNAGAEVYPDSLPPISGDLRFRGLPFLIGPGSGVRGPGSGESARPDSGPRTPDPGPSRPFLIAFGEELRAAPLAIPIGKTARCMIVAHARLNSQIPEGDPVGRLVGEYEF